MSHHDDHGDVVTDPEVDDTVEMNGNGTAPGLTVLDRLKARRDELAAARTFELEVAGTSGLLVLELGPLSRERFATLQHRAAKSNSPEAELNLNADTLIAATRAVLGRESRAEPLRPIHPDGETTRIDDRLAALLRLPAPTRARDVLRAAFSMAPSPDLAIAAATGEYMQWAAATEDEIDEEFVGESEAATR